MIGLGVGIDYALFIVTRHREHLHDGMSPQDAAGQATATAGQSVLFAGTTVVIAICGLLLAGIPAITAMGFAIGITVVVVDAHRRHAAARTARPRRAPHRQAQDPPQEGGRHAHATVSGKWAHHVGRRPWRYAVVSFVGLVAAAAPVLGMRIGFTDDSNEAAGSTARESYELLEESFGPGLSGTLNAVIEVPAGDTTTTNAVREALAATDGVAAVSAPILSEAGDTAVISIIPTVLAAGRGHVRARRTHPLRRPSRGHRRHRGRPPTWSARPPSRRISPTSSASGCRSSCSRSSACRSCC